MNKNLSRARTINTVGKIFFFLAMLFAVLLFAIAVTSVGVAGKEDTALFGFVLGGGALIFSVFGVFLFSQIEAVFLGFAEADAKKAMEEFPGEDGMTGDFCREMFSYTPAQLRLILDEQKEDYTPEEYAYIEKVLARKTQKK